MGLGRGKKGEEEKKGLPSECFKHSCADRTETGMQRVCGIKISWVGAIRRIVSEKAPGGRR